MANDSPPPSPLCQDPRSLGGARAATHSPRSLHYTALFAICMLLPNLLYAATEPSCPNIDTWHYCVLHVTAEEPKGTFRDELFEATAQSALACRIALVKALEDKTASWYQAQRWSFSKCLQYLQDNPKSIEMTTFQKVVPTKE